MYLINRPSHKHDLIHLQIRLGRVQTCSDRFCGVEIRYHIVSRFSTPSGCFTKCFSQVKPSERSFTQVTWLEVVGVNLTTFPSACNPLHNRYIQQYKQLHDTSVTCSMTCVLWAMFIIVNTVHYS